MKLSKGLKEMDKAHHGLYVGTFTLGLATAGEFAWFIELSS